MMLRKTCWCRSVRVSRRRPTFWLNPKNGVSYNLSVMTPQYKVDSLQALMNTPINGPSGCSPSEILANLATVNADDEPRGGDALQRGCLRWTFTPASTGAIWAASRTMPIKILKPFEKTSATRHADARASGRWKPCSSSYSGLVIGLVMSIVLVYLLIVVNFQSWLDPFIIITALPGALAGILLDAVSDSHHAQRSGVDGCGDVHGRGNSQQHSADFVCARTHGRRHATPFKPRWKRVTPACAR